MTVIVRFRPYKKGDDAEIRRLVNNSTFVTVNPFFFNTVMKEFTAQIVLMLAAVLFIVLDLPLFLAIASAPTSFFAIYLIIYMGHWIKTIKAHNDLNNIDALYSGRKAFFVAEVINDAASHSSDDFMFANSNYEFPLDSPPPEIVGTIALNIKSDPDMGDPPTSVAWLRRMAVKPKYREKGIGSRLIDVALSHCKSKEFQAVELITSQYHDSARNLYYRKGFKMKKSYKKNLLFGSFPIEMYRLRKDLKEVSHYDLTKNA